MPHHAIPYHTTPHHVIPYHTAIQCNIVQFNTIQDQTIPQQTCMHAYLPTYLPPCMHACMHTYIHTYRMCNTFNTSGAQWICDDHGMIWWISADPCALIQPRPSGCQSAAHHWYVDGKTLIGKLWKNYGKNHLQWMGKLWKNHLKNGWERNGDAALIWSNLKVPCSLQLHRPAIQCDHWLPKELELLRLEPIRSRARKNSKIGFIRVFKVMFDLSHDIKSSQISSNFWIEICRFQKWVSLRFRWCARYLRFRVLSVPRSQLDLGSPGGLSVWVQWGLPSGNDY